MVVKDGVCVWAGLDDIRLIEQQNVSWERRAQIKQVTWPIAERQIELWKSCLVLPANLSARFPVVNWRSRPVAKSAYYEKKTVFLCLLNISEPNDMTINV